ncbi:MAG TPA: sterol desaturase family protein, partial [Gemmataceae bacterium]|nr:sterol desaturase family protein [Gemmataceae bacterium]
MSLRQRLSAGARACGAVALRPFIYQPPNPWLPAIVYGTMGAGFVAWNLLAERPPLWAWVVLPLVGVFLWTLLEYVLHSQLFHDPPPRLRWLSVSHGQHHDAPHDPTQVVARLSFSFPVAVAFYGVLSLALWSPQWAGLAMIGLVSGYVSYEVLHYSIHQVPWVRRLVKPLASHHLHHHYADPTRCFGVTTPVWDWVFRTTRRHRVVVTNVAEPTPT